MMRVGLITMVAIAVCRPGGVAAQDLPREAPPPAAVRSDILGARASAVQQDVPVAPLYPAISTLKDALIRTYRTNPTLMAQRAALRGLDSGAALERADGRPQIATAARFNEELYSTRRLGTLGRELTGGIDAEQVLFAGGRIRNAVRAADTRVIAGRADVRAVEGEVLTETVTVYADLVRDRAIRDNTRIQVEALDANLTSTRSRRRVNDLTQADVAQSEARLALARGSLAVAEGRVQASEENFERVVGARAGVLEPLPPLPPMPLTVGHAVDIALAGNADVAAFAARVRAAGYDVAAVKAERLPTISAVGSTAYSTALGTADRAAGLPPGSLPNSATSIGAGFRLRLPLYQGGAASARVRSAEEARAVLIEQGVAVERVAVATARSAFATWQASLRAITENEAAVAANEVALRSVRIEQTVGSRDIIDVLNAEQELLASRIALAGAERDAYVEAFGLLNAMGAAEAADLHLGLGPETLYDPRRNYSAYGRTWSDWADGRPRPAASTRTVPGNANSPLTGAIVARPGADDPRP